MERLHSPIMASNFVGLLFIFSLALVSSVATDEWIPKTEIPSCIKMINGYLSTNSSTLQEFYLRAAAFMCKPGFKVSAEQNGCLERGHFQRFATYECRLRRLVETDCSAIARAVNCVLDLTGAVCGGDEAIVFLAFLMEYKVVVDKASAYGECAIATLHDRQKHPERRVSKFPPDMNPKMLCSAIGRGDANKTSDPEYYEQRASAILCDGEELKKFAKETNDCINNALVDHKIQIHCRIRGWDGDVCEDQTKMLRCQVELLARRCGGQRVVDVYAFAKELSYELLREENKDSEVGFRQSECLDAIMAELRALQTPKKASPIEN